MSADVFLLLMSVAPLKFSFPRKGCGLLVPCLHPVHISVFSNLSSERLNSVLKWPL